MEKLLRKVLKKITPTEKEKALEKKTAEKIIKQIESTKGNHLGAMLVGSIARDTHIRGDRDMDIFVMFPREMPRAEFERNGLAVARKVFRGHKCWKEYSEHPYLKGIIDGFEVEIVPSYKVKKASELQSAVDRSPFHTRFMLKRLNAKLRGEARLFKAFLKGIDCYGAKIEKEGFSGYLAELVVLKYGSFKESLKAISKWQHGTVLSLSRINEKHAREKFDAPLVFIDPTDKNRNVAAALSTEQFARVIVASRAFLQKPARKFFYPKKKSSISKKRMKKLIDLDQIFTLRMPFPSKALSDVIWGQMRRLKKLLKNALESEGFLVRRITLYAEEENGIDYFVELEALELNKTVIRVGPFAWQEEHSKAFIEKHKRALTGPRIENGKWVIEELRKHTSAVKLAREFIQKRKKLEKGPFKKALAKCNILEKKEFLKTARKDPFFKYSLSVFLKGKEKFL